MPSIEVNLSNFCKEYLPLAFQGYWNTGYCFLRLWIRNGKPFILCCQLPDYNGTSVTNAVEEIVKAVASTLLKEKDPNDAPIVKIGFTSRLLRMILRRAAWEQRLTDEVMHIIHSHGVWIEHYPPKTGLHDEGDFAEVVFSSSGEPVWNIGPKEELYELGVSETFLLVNYHNLQSWKNATSK